MASNKFEKLIEYVVANDDKKARQLFHKIVVDKSRKIYEDLDLEDNSRAFDDVESDETAVGDAGPIGEEEGLDEFGGDEADDLEQDTFVDDEDEFGLESDDEFGAEGDLTPEVDDRLADLESNFDELKAEFEALAGDMVDTDEDELEGNEEEVEDLEGEDEELLGDEEAAEEVEDEVEDLEGEDEEESEEEEKEEPVDESIIREYVDKVTKGLANTTEEPSTNKKSVVAGKNPLASGSASAKNIVAGGTEKGRTAPTSGKFTPEVVNVPGGKAKLKPVAKPTSKEAEGTNKKSNLS
jgi:hypothetical protein